MTRSRAVYASGSLAVYMKRLDLRDLINNGSVVVPFFVEQWLVEDGAVTVTMTDHSRVELRRAHHAILNIINAAKGKSSWGGYRWGKRHADKD